MNWKFIFDTLPKDYKEFVGKTVDPNGSLRVAIDWNKMQPKSKDDFLKFYKQIGTLDELAFWHTFSKDHPKIRATRKIIKTIQALPIKTIVDLGAGIGTDALILAYLDYKVTCIEPNREQLDFIKFRATNHNIKIENFIEGTEESVDKKYEVVLFIEVIEHVHDPFAFIDRITQYHPDFLVFTQSFKQHEAPGGLPQHTDFSITKIFKHLIAKKYIKVKINGTAYPPNLWSFKGRVKEIDITSRNIVKPSNRYF